MDQIAQLKIEYFELCKLLNKSNLKINQRTDVLFFIDTSNGRSIMSATTNGLYKIQLIFHKYDDTWRPCDFSGLYILEQQLSRLFLSQNPEILKKLNITKLIRSFIFQKVDE